MKRILGLDLGSASIGWAVIEESDLNRGENKILGMGSRIIPYEGTEGKDFAKGTGETRCALRTKARTARKGYDRYQLRRKFLIDVLIKNNMLPDEKVKSYSKMQLWGLRNKAVDQQIDLKELGRILLWLNQRRGYKSIRTEANLNKSDTDYVLNVKNNHHKIKELNLTIGQYFYHQLKIDNYFRIKEKIFPREAYIEEFDTIFKKQQGYYQEILSESLYHEIRNKIIYYQRPLKSQKGLVSICEFEGFSCKGKDGKEYFVGPKVIHKSSPLFQITKIWENINNIRIYSREGHLLIITQEQKNQIFDFLDNHDKLTITDLARILQIDKSTCSFNKQLAKGLQGNITKHHINSCLNQIESGRLLKFNLNIIRTENDKYHIDKKTGEILNVKKSQFVDPAVENEPLYKLWHTIYSINDKEECSNALQFNFNLSSETSEKLASIDFTKYGFGNKSAKACRKILPYLIQGDDYSSAMSYAGYNHSDSKTKTENLQRNLLNKLKPLAKGSLRQPIVEKILNQMVNLINAIIDKYGKPDEIRVELARELKQSKEERNETDKEINKRERENDNIKKRLSEYGLRGTKNNIIKWRLYEEIDNEDKKLNAICIYCGQPISLLQALKGEEVDVEHIIPKAKIFDDSQSNKTLAHKKCNKNKNDMTAYDFMKTKPESDFNEYIERINTLYAAKIISATKRNKLLMSEDKIPDNFIDRQLRESQYIAKKAKEILQGICHNVYSTSGTVTSELRHLWGWDEVTMNLQLKKYRDVDLTYIEETDRGKKEKIIGWTKRDDHRHHAIDALTIACTKQGFIQRFNTLNSSKTREDMCKNIEASSIQFKEKLSLLAKYIISQQPFTVSVVEKSVSEILVSFKAGKKVAVFGTRKVGNKGQKRIVQKSILVPRGALSEEQVYGRIKTLDYLKPLKYIFTNYELIFKPYIRELVKSRLNEYNGDAKEALRSLKNDPIYLDKNKTILLEYATCLKETYVFKYPVNTYFNKTEDVIDGNIRKLLQKRLNKFSNNPKEAFKDIKVDDKIVKWYEDEGLERPILSVRCFTGLTGLISGRKNESGTPVGFLKSGNNHHIAIYHDKEGNKHTHCCTFWHAVERKKYGFPVIIKNCEEIWNRILENKTEFQDAFLQQLPLSNWTFELSFQQNEMFLLNKEQNEIDFFNNCSLSERLYRVQKLSLIPSSGQLYIVFRHHLETEIVDSNESKISKRFILVQSLNSLFDLKPVKVAINMLGDIKVNSRKTALV
ncbi:MAG TPA: type II CRISPR RNA-guided endonuclease Cas9 [Lentimicrobium sp.]|nr:type II CRISPR RNA-guided endonuclease Cas9 [Lentimicrobium sp.]